MHIRAITVTVKPEQVKAFIAASLTSLEQTQREPGVIQFEFLQRAEEPTRFLVVETYRDEAARQAHLESAHFQAWRQTVGPMLAAPPVSVPYLPVWVGP
jgi:quinol monooxygenase YgiN